jgi:hypothetical protein
MGTRAQQNYCCLDASLLLGRLKALQCGRSVASTIVDRNNNVYNLTVGGFELGEVQKACGEVSSP